MPHLQLAATPLECPTTCRHETRPPLSFLVPPSYSVPYQQGTCLPHTHRGMTKRLVKTHGLEYHFYTLAVGATLWSATRNYPLLKP